MRRLGHSGSSQAIPEVEQDNLTAESAQLEAFAVLVLTLDLRRLLADRQVADLSSSMMNAACFMVMTFGYTVSFKMRVNAIYTRQNSLLRYRNQSMSHRMST